MNEWQTAPILDQGVVTGLKELGGEDDPGLFAELCEIFLRDAEKLLKALDESLHSGDVHLFERSAHTLKSSSANIGAMRMSKLAFEMEKMGRSKAIAAADPLIREASSHFADVRTALDGAR